MKKKLLALLLCTQLTVGQGTFAAVPVSDAFRTTEPVQLIVEIDGDPLCTLKGIDAPAVQSMQANALLKTQAQVLGEIAENADEEITPIYTYTELFNGFSIETTRDQIEKIKALPHVKAVEEVAYFTIIEPMLTTSGDLLNLPLADDDFAYRGENQAVAVIDSEFDVNHEFFNMTPSNPKLTSASIQASGLSYPNTYKSSKIPFAYDYGRNVSDTYSTSNIHGTHVAGIIGGRETQLPNGKRFSGIAPQAQLVLMKVSDQQGIINTATMARALEDAYKIGVDCVNISLGTDYTAKNSAAYHSTGVSIQRLREAGVSVACANGNAARGFQKNNTRTEPFAANIDYTSSGLPNAFSDCTAIASSNNSEMVTEEYGVFLCSDQISLEFHEVNAQSTFISSFSDRTIQLVNCENGSNLTGMNLSGKLAVIRRDPVAEIPFATSSQNAKAAGAIGVIYLNTDDTYIQTPELILPAAIIKNTDSSILLQYSEVTVARYPHHVPIKTAREMSPYSAWGTSDDLELKPELTAPGGAIYSSVPGNQYKTMSGTSMAAPHAAAAFALMNQFYQTNPFSAQNNGKAGGEKSALLENLMMSTAAIQKQADGTYYSPRLQGAGLINLQSAVKTPAILLGNSGKSKISLGDQLTNEFTLTATVQNLTDQPVTYHSISVTTLLDGYTSDHRVSTSKPIANESDAPSAITVPANGSKTLQIPVTLDGNMLQNQANIFTNGFFIDGFLELSSNDNIVPIHLPFTGFYGDWLDEPIFDQTIYDEGGSQLISEDGIKANGTFLFSKTGDEFYPLGQNGYNQVTDKKFIAISPNKDGNGDVLGFNITPWRNVGKVEILMKGAINIPMEKNDLQKFNKNAFAYNLPGVPDGDYQLEITGYYPTDTEKTRPQTIKLPLVVDSQKPDMTGCINGSVLTVFPDDNHYVEYVHLVYEDQNGQERESLEPVIYSDDTAEPVQFDLSDAEQSTVRITACDYADNKTERTLAQCLNPITTAINSDTANQISFTADNIGYEKTVDLYIAFYSKNRLVSVIPYRNVTLHSGKNTYQQTLSGAEKTADSYSILYWNAGTVHPVSQAYHK